ncbi:hypothetical protein SAMN05421827_10990 [Pedobacter terrae]|uniref:Uncharacterized protein n=1 Tax=Pedobacter terrae TaxID=405671 RepID=A0A1G7W3Z0_9SPHI|nr:hypothetical protein [Pedobacter terrae]SDG66686.1 hypothetical protein SAMN05421827_10990 [Pedobacter terrae]
MENSNKPTKKILTPSVVHNDLPEVKKPEHLRKLPARNDDALPENPERNYHHEELKSVSSGHKEIRQADDDVWNGEDA